MGFKKIYKDKKRNSKATWNLSDDDEVQIKKWKDDLGNDSTMG